MGRIAGEYVVKTKGRVGEMPVEIGGRGCESSSR